MEFFFSWGETDTTGNHRSEPRTHLVHSYRETINMGHCRLEEMQIHHAIGELVRAWPESSYHPITRNCVTFAEAMISRLEAPESFPRWVHGAADWSKGPV